MNGRELVEEVSRYLTDQEEGFEYTHWEQADLFSYFKHALNIVASVNRAKFTKRREVKLLTGSVQDTNMCADARIIGFKTSTGDIMPVRKLTRDPSAAIDRPICSDTSNASEYKMTAWAQYDTDDSAIWVYPPVPAGVDAVAIVSCYAPPNPQTEEEQVDMPPEFRAAVFELMLYYAFGVDIESVPMRERSESHFNKAFTIMGVAVTAAGTRKAAK